MINETESEVKPVRGTESRDFWIRVDPSGVLTRHNITVAGGFSSVIPDNYDTETLMFVPNPNFKGFVGTFQNNLLSRYIAEYNLELARRASFASFPSRLQAIFLFPSEHDAEQYWARNPSHIQNRLLKKVRTSGYYYFSDHDSSWIDFFRLEGWKDQATINEVTKAYWSGLRVKDCTLQSMGKHWTRRPIIEILFLGTVEFYDRKLPNLDEAC